MTRRMRRALPWIFRGFFFLGVLALGILGVTVLVFSAMWAEERFVGPAIAGTIAAVWALALFALLTFWSAPRLFATWDRERDFEDARRCARCDRGTRPLFHVAGVEGFACKPCLPFVERKAAGNALPLEPEARARRGGL